MVCDNNQSDSKADCLRMFVGQFSCLCCLVDLVDVIDGVVVVVVVVNALDGQ